MQLVSTSTMTAAAGLIGTGTTTSIDSVWPIVVLAIAIPLAFYVLHKILGLLPGSRSSRR
jgi:hypothetical protein